MRAFVTGGAGFVGSHIVRLLCRQGAEVRVLVRTATALDNLLDLDVECVYGDLLDPAPLRRGAAGCDVVYHCAADYRLWTSDPSELYAHNVQGTENMLRACAYAGVARVVYTSSVAAVGIPKGGPGCEETPVSLADMIGDYKRSKFLAQKVALHHAERGLPVVIVNPSTPIGPGDRKPTATGQLVVDFLNRAMPAYVDTGLNLVAVEDVAAGHLLAAEKGIPGRTYILGNQNLTLKQILDLLGELTGLPSPGLRMPHLIALGIGALDSFVEGRLLRRPPRVSLEAVKMSLKKMWFSSERAVAELGYRPTPVRDALLRACRWFVEHGYAPVPPAFRRAA
ncbi:MAG: hopanoid-associated sugar epimerase [Candidatus Eremiobacterota bacterium]